jgi:nitroreductase
VRFGRQPPTAEVCLIMRPEENALYSRIWRGPAISKTGPPDGERPSAYIVVLGDMEITRSFGCDHGIAAQTMLLGAVEKGLGGCMIDSIDRDGLRQALTILPRFEILPVLVPGQAQGRSGHRAPEARWGF